MGIETYEEWQLGQLDALIALGEYEKAYKTYEKAVRIYTEVSDLPVSEEMLKRSRKISQYLKGGYGAVDWGTMMAMLVLAIVPIVVFYVACQKYIIEGVVAGAVKG